MVRNESTSVCLMRDVQGPEYYCSLRATVREGKQSLNSKGDGSKDALEKKTIPTAKTGKRW